MNTYDSSEINPYVCQQFALNKGDKMIQQQDNLNKHLNFVQFSLFSHSFIPTRHKISLATQKNLE